MKRIVLGFLVLLFSVGCGSKGNSVELIPASQRLKAPEFKADFLNSKENLNLAKLKNKVIVMDFWATWCGPCRMELPYLVQLHKRYKSKGVEFLGLSVETNDGRPKEYFDKFLSSYGIEYPTGLASMDTLKTYGINPIPTTFFIDKSGKIALSFVGARPEGDFVGAIEKLLKE